MGGLVGGVEFRGRFISVEDVARKAVEGVWTMGYKRAIIYLDLQSGRLVRELYLDASLRSVDSYDYWEPVFEVTDRDIASIVQATAEAIAQREGISYAQAKEEVKMDDVVDWIVKFHGDKIEEALKEAVEKNPPTA